MSNNFRSAKWLPLAGNLSAWVLGAVFLLAGFNKALARDDFTLAVWQYGLTDWQTSTLIAAILPWLEITFGAMLFIRHLRPPALVATTALLLIFSFALGSAILRNLEISCGCFGANTPFSDPGLAIVRNFALLALAGVAWFDCHHHSRQNRKL